MPFMALRPIATYGLGALPPAPPTQYTTQGGQLQPNHQWVRYYEVDRHHQLKQCPPNAPMGCWMINGYAWGQREWYPEEFAPKGFVLQPLPKPFPHPAQIATAPAPVHHRHVSHRHKRVTPSTTTPSAPAPSPSYQPVVSAPLPPSPPPQVPAPIGDVSPQDTPNDTIVSEPTPTPTTSRLGVGSLVGIGLFIAIGLTLLRK